MNVISDHQAIQHVFTSRVSGTTEVGEVSGWGVGLDVIMEAAKHLGGTTEIHSTVGEGTGLVITVPYFEDIRQLDGTERTTVDRG